jgi:hypothetical protein
MAASATISQNPGMANRKVALSLPARLFADDYSSSGQEAWLTGGRGTSSAYWRDDYSGQLRFDSLLSRTLVIPDSHIFDGPFFLATGPASLKQSLGRAGLGHRSLPALEVRGRESTLSDSLAALLRRPGHATLNAFVFKSLPPDLRYLVAAELKRTPEAVLDRALASADDVPAAVASVLRKCIGRIDTALDAEALLGPMVTGWRRWLDESAWIVVTNHPTYTRFDLSAQLTQEEPIDGVLRTTTGQGALAQVQSVIAEGSGHRSDVSELLAHLRDNSREDELGLEDLEIVDLWYSRLRYRALAARHGCSCNLSDRPWLPPVGAGQALLREALELDSPKHVPLPDDVLTTLGDLQGEEFQEFIRRQRRAIVRLWEAPSDDALHQLADALAQLTRQRERAPLGIAQLLPTAGGTVGALAGGAGAPIGGLIGTFGKAILDRQKTEPERVRIRVEEAVKSRITSTRASSHAS